MKSYSYVLKDGPHQLISIEIVPNFLNIRPKPNISWLRYLLTVALACR